MHPQSHVEPSTPRGIPETPQHERLEPFIGAWEIIGQAYDAPFVRAAKVSGHEIFEWFPGKSFLIHRLDGHLGDAPISCMALTRYDAATMMFAVSTFYNDGTHRSMQAHELANTWIYTGEIEVAGHMLQNRCTVTFEDGGDRRISRWEYSNDGETWHLYWEAISTRV